MSLPRRKLTPEEYLEIDRRAEIKSEFWDGEMFAMAGGSEQHAYLITNVVGELRSHFKGRPCKVWPDTLRVKVWPTGRYTYPDAVALCGEPHFEDAERDTLVNPMVLFEVLSPSSEDHDRGKKFFYYRSIESVTDYVLIAQNAINVEHFSRQPDGTWVFRAYTRLDQEVGLPSLGVRLALAEIYDKVEIPAR